MDGGRPRGPGASSEPPVASGVSADALASSDITYEEAIEEISLESLSSLDEVLHLFNNMLILTGIGMYLHLRIFILENTSSRLHSFDGLSSLFMHLPPDGRPPLLCALPSGCTEPSSSQPSILLFTHSPAGDHLHVLSPFLRAAPRLTFPSVACAPSPPAWPGRHPSDRPDPALAAGQPGGQRQLRQGVTPRARFLASGRSTGS
jgi:hypothetical protein